ncbi:MAG: TerB N-terminal domain-containing protein [FCB group bacterium]|nr:TerB N-terminal domain-containing protein [FCB group bacterium]
MLKNDLFWAEPGKSLIVAGYTIPEGMLYWSKGPASEASCIDISLPVGRPVEEPKGSLGYWPQYGRMTPDQRANYLAWLASGRKAPLHDIGYAFVYFYGLERRVLVDGADVQPALKETLRLLSAYRGSGSFFSYLSNFIAYVLARKGVAKLPEEWFRWVFLDALPELNEDALAVALAWVSTHGRPLPAKLAFAVAKQDMRSPKSVVIKRAGEQFYELFRKKYQEKFGEGMRTSGILDRYVEYRPASPCLLEPYAERRFERLRLPNPLGMQVQFTPLVQIWTECITELKPFSSELVKGQGKLTREAFKALPQALKAEVEHPDKPRWETVITEHAKEDGFVFVTVGELARIAAIPQRSKLSVKQSMDLVETAKDMGFAIVPDPWILRRCYDWDELVAIQSLDKESEPGQEGYFRAAALMLAIGMTMAAADGKIDREEVIHVSLGIKSQFKLNRGDARKLEAYREILIRKPPTFRSLTGFVQSAFEPKQREALGQFIVGVAAVDGVIDKSERRALENAYETLGLPAIKLHNLLRRLEGEPDEALIVPSQPTPVGRNCLADPDTQVSREVRFEITQGVELSSQEDSAPSSQDNTYNAATSPVEPDPNKAETRTKESLNREHWDMLVSKHVQKDGLPLVPVGALAHLMDMSESPRLTLQQSLDLSRAAQSAGLALVPDCYMLRRSFEWNEKVAVIPSVSFTLSGQGCNFVTAALMLELGLAIARTDGCLDAKETRRALSAVRGYFNLSQDEVKRLEAYRDVLVQAAPTFRNLAAIAPRQRDLLLMFLADVAAADGVVSNAERDALENAYRLFGLTVAKPYAESRESREPSQDQVHEEDHQSFLSSVHEEILPTRPRVALNRELINRILGETASVAEMIGNAMDNLKDQAEEEAQTEPPSFEPEDSLPTELVENAEPSEEYEGLDFRYHPALTELITRREWSTDDFNALARRHGLMPAAMMEVINSWTDELYGDFLIEEGDPYVIQVELLEAA